MGFVNAAYDTGTNRLQDDAGAGRLGSISALMFQFHRFVASSQAIREFCVGKRISFKNIIMIQPTPNYLPRLFANKKHSKKKETKQR